VSTELVEPIPWTFSDTRGVLLWTWVTEHFLARINGAEVTGGAEEAGDRRLIRSYAWDLSDLMRTNQGLPRLLVEGTALTFEDAESSIREHLGKCYDPRLGYRRFAGALAFTFTLSTGEPFDVSELVGTHCSVTVMMPDRSERTLMGDLEVSHYKWQLMTRDQVLEIMPEHVIRVTNRSEAAERATAVVRGDLYSGVGRIYQQDPRAGCTGRAGFMVGTVDHAGAPRCPIHEIGVPEHLLR
jgi:hypothetical protein